MRRYNDPFSEDPFDELPDPDDEQVSSLLGSATLKPEEKAVLRKKRVATYRRKGYTSYK
jgi:hypothetical protein